MNCTTLPPECTQLFNPAQTVNISIDIIFFPIHFSYSISPNIINLLLALMKSVLEFFIVMVIKEQLNCVCKSLSKQLLRDG